MGSLPCEIWWRVRYRTGRVQAARMWVPVATIPETSSTTSTKRLAARSPIEAQAVISGTSLSIQCRPSRIICQTRQSSSAIRWTTMAQQAITTQWSIKEEEATTPVMVIISSSNSRCRFSSIYRCFRSTSLQCHWLEVASVPQEVFHTHRHSSRVAHPVVYKSVAKSASNIRACKLIWR